MKRAPKELLDAVKEIAKASAPAIRIRGRLLDLLEDWQPVDHYNAAYFTEDGVGSAVEILRKDVADRKRATELESVLAAHALSRQEWIQRATERSERINELEALVAELREIIRKQTDDFERLRAETEEWKKLAELAREFIASADPDAYSEIDE
jgi:hypothetical protein